MNILLIGTTDILGGAAKVSWTIRDHLIKQGHQVSMFVADKRSTDPSVKVIPRSYFRKLIGFLLATESLINTDWILDTEEFKKADIVHCHNLHGRFFDLKTLQKMSLLKPVIWTLHDEWALTPHCAYTLQGSNMTNGLYICPSKDTQPRILWDNTAHLCQEKNMVYENSRFTVVTPSKWLFDRVKNTTLNKQNVIHIPNGIDTSKFVTKDKNQVREKLGLPLDKKIILFLANDAKNNTWKGWKYAEAVITHFKEDKRLICLRVGNHQVEKEDANKSEILTNIIDRPYTSDASLLADYYCAADALIFTSIAENFPLVILEAMACGLPIISFGVGGVTEVVKHTKNGYIANYLDSSGLIEGIKWLLSLKNAGLQTMAATNSSLIKNQYSQEIMCKSYLDLYNKLINDKPSKKG